MTTLQDSRTDSIAHLDFAPRCTCDAPTCGHPDGQECGAEATAILTVHLVSACDGDDTDADGNEVGPVCTECLDKLTEAVAAWTHKVRQIVRRNHSHAACDTCGAPMMCVSDVIRDVRPLK